MLVISWYLTTNFLRHLFTVDGISFGVHNPEELPRSETDFQVIASSFGLLSADKIPPGIEDGILDPRMFSERKLFIDPDIIGIVLDICFVFVSLVYHDETHVCFMHVGYLICSNFEILKNNKDLVKEKNPYYLKTRGGIKSELQIKDVYVLQDLRKLL